MLDIFNRTTPAYKRATASKVVQAQPAAPSKLSGLIGSLFGTQAPNYKSADGRSVQTQTTSGLWSMFAAASPSYKTAPAVMLEDEAMNLGDVAGADDMDAGLHGVPTCVAGSDELVLL